jgi:hypothetical protein
MYEAQSPGTTPLNSHSAEMPLFYFSTDDSLDAEDGLDYPDVSAAREAGAEALRQMAAENMGRSGLYTLNI